MKLAPFFAALSLVSASHVLAGDAFFSPDGKSVAFIHVYDGKALRKVDLATKKVETIQLALPEAESAVTLAAGTDGEALFTTEKSLWVHDAKGTRKICDTTGAENVNDLTIAPSKHPTLADWVLIAGSEKEDPQRQTFFYRKPGEKAFKNIFCRRVTMVSAGVFTPEGRFFFSGDGDLWEGGIDTEDPELITLNGIRIAPLGFLNTDAANGGSMYVDRIMPTNGSIYVALGGHHIGQLLRLAMNPKPALEEGSGADENPKGNYSYMAKNLSSVEILDDSGEPIRNSAAITINGDDLLFYTKGGSTLNMYLWRKSTGKSEEVGTIEDK